MTTAENGANIAQPQSPERLAFASDKGASRSVWIAGFLVIAIVGWMGSGFVIPAEEDTPVVAREEQQPVAVAVSRSVAQTVTQFYQAEGQALPDRDTSLRAEATGDVAELFVRKGDDVTAGQVIARLDSTTSDADMARAREDVTRAQRDFDNATELRARGVGTVDRVSQAQTALVAAQSQLTRAEEALKSLTITAPFAGRLEMLGIDEGEFVSAGSQVGRLVDITPLTVAIQVPQQELTRLTVGQAATVRFITGEEHMGELTFVGTSASAETRTFLAEVEVANADGAIPAGISAEVIIPTGETTAHFLSPSIVSLSTEGALGVKTVDDDATVLFYPIQVVKAQIDGVWVTGLPDEIDLITVGQGFVNAGEIVAPMAQEDTQ